MLPRPSDALLVEQSRFQRRAGAGEQRSEPRGVEFRRERLGAESAHPRMLLQRLGRREVHEAEASRIVIGDDPTVIEDENDVIVLRIL